MISKLGDFSFFKGVKVLLQKLKHKLYIHNYETITLKMESELWL